MTEKQNNKAELDTCKITAYILHIAPNRGFSFFWRTPCLRRFPVSLSSSATCGRPRNATSKRGTRPTCPAPRNSKRRWTTKSPSSLAASRRKEPCCRRTNHAKPHQPRNSIPARSRPAHPLCSGPVHDHRGAIPP